MEQANNKKEVQLLERLLRCLVDGGVLQHRLSDLFIRINMETGEVILYGDDDEPLTSTVIFSYIGKGDDAFQEAIQQLKRSIANLSKANYWEHELFERPFSIELVDDAFTPIEELLFLDDDIVKISPPLLEHLDQELSDFIRKLLEE